jgi:glutamine---fructose-6-phosphate transaminase (isomerizing)
MTAGVQVRSEMAEQPEVLARIVERRADLRRLLTDRLPGVPTGVSLIARGSSDNVAVHARYLLELATGLPVSSVAPSLITRYHRAPRIGPGHVVVALSQSGRTPEIVAVAQHLAEQGAFVVSVTNDADSPLATAAAVSLLVGTSTERAVPATKTVTGQLALVTLLAESVGADLSAFTGGDAAWSALPAVVAEVLADTAPVQDAVKVLRDNTTGIHLARGLTYAAALEGALKSKETSRRVHEGYSSADFLHGPLTVASPDVTVVAYATAGPVLQDVVDTAAAAADLGSPVIGVGHPGVGGDVLVPVPQTLGEALAVLPLVVRGQQLAVQTTLALGLDPDRPTGLHKVTETH